MFFARILKGTFLVSCVVMLPSVKCFGQQLLLQTDRNLYLAGEIIWFSVHRMYMPASDDVLYAELMDPTGHATLQAKIAMQPQAAKGSFYLPANLPTGRYHLRVYTRSVRKYPTLFNEIPLTVINSLAVPAPAAPDTSEINTGAVQTSINAADVRTPQGELISVKTNAQTYGTRQPVQLQISNGDGQSDSLHLSVAVFLEDSLSGWAQTLTQTVAAAPQVTSVDVLPAERRGHLIRALVKDAQSGSPANDLGIYLSIPSAPTQLYVGKTDAKGLVQFEVEDYYGPGEVFLQPFMDQDSAKWQIELLSPFLAMEEGRKEEQLPLTQSLENQLLQRSIAMQAQNLYWADSLKHFKVPAFRDTLPFYGTPDISYQLDDYVRFVTMEEVMREYITPIGVSMRKGELGIRLFHPVQEVFVENNILVMLDGVPLRHFNRIFQYDPLKVKKIDIIQSPYVYGYNFVEGIVHLVTYDHIYNGYELEPSLLAQSYDGLQLDRPFFSPQYETDSSRNQPKPDLRTTLFWAGDLVTSQSQSLQFYTGDQPGRYRVEVKGLDEKGHLVSGSALFTVE